jgi:hypothetical protein
MNKTGYLLLAMILVSLAGGLTASAQYYIIPVKPEVKAPVLQTGQKRCATSLSGWEWAVSCDNDEPGGQDGALQAGLSWSVPRFSDRSNGTVLDRMTGLLWLKDARCMGAETWPNALAAAGELYEGSSSGTDCNLTDGSQPGDWRLPSINELLSLVHRDYYSPAMSDFAGTAQWTSTTGFLNLVWFSKYWSSTTYAKDPDTAWQINFQYGLEGASDKLSHTHYYVWPVRKIR